MDPRELPILERSEFAKRLRAIVESPAQLDAVGLGTAATQAATSFQAQSALLDALVAAASVYGTSLIAALVGAANQAAARTALGLTIGTDVLAYDAELAQIASAAASATKGDMLVHNGTSWALLTAGSEGQALRINADGTPEWMDA